METKLSKLIRRCLKRQSLTRVEFIRRMGYQNLSQGQQRLSAWLRGLATPTGDQPERIARAGAVSVEVVVQALVADQKLCQEQRLARRAQDPHFYLVVRAHSNSAFFHPLPKGITETAALTLARARARIIGHRCRLDAPDGQSHWIDEQGAVCHVGPDEPLSTEMPREGRRSKLGQPPEAV